jgi:hypothetical protein
LVSDLHHAGGEGCLSEGRGERVEPPLLVLFVGNASFAKSEVYLGLELLVLEEALLLDRTLLLFRVLGEHGYGRLLLLGDHGLRGEVLGAQHAGAACHLVSEGRAHGGGGEPALHAGQDAGGALLDVHGAQAHVGDLGHLLCLHPIRSIGAGEDEVGDALHQAGAFLRGVPHLFVEAELFSRGGQAGFLLCLPRLHPFPRAIGWTVGSLCVQFPLRFPRLHPLPRPVSRAFVLWHQFLV